MASHLHHCLIGQMDEHGVGSIRAKQVMDGTMLFVDFTDLLNELEDFIQLIIGKE